MQYHFSFLPFEKLPASWDEVVASKNILLSKSYFHALENAKPDNMKLEYISFYRDDMLIGGALIQHLYFNRHQTFNKGNMVQCGIRNRIINILANKVAILGNNMLSGQNGFYFDLEKISKEDSLNLLFEACQFFEKQNSRNKLLILKDYNETIMNLIPSTWKEKFMPFEVQPGMILEIKNRWQSFEEYYNSMTKKYRARIRTARTKFNGIEKRELIIEDLEQFENEMFDLYKTVADKATFNTFYLVKNHFTDLKRQLQNRFKVFGYFLNNEMVGFYSLILNFNELDTYFLGYDEELQKTHQLYLNMLIDMVEEGIELQVEKINFGRTAIEIKSTIGAKPQKLYGLMRHKYGWVNQLLPNIFKQINPSQEYVLRNPFQ